MGSSPFQLARTLLTTLLRAAPTGTARTILFDPIVGRGIADTIRGVFVSGTAVTVPIFVTVAVMGFVLNFLSNVLSPFVQLLAFLGVASDGNVLLAQTLTLVSIVVAVFLAGVATESNSTRRVAGNVEGMVEGIPGVGSVYSSFDRMSDVLLDSDSESFQEVKLLEFPHEGLYSLAFVTADLPDGVGEESDMQVLFVPLAPNPVMGGFMLCVPKSRVREVDMSVQQAFQALVTSGVAMAETDE